MKRGGQDMCRRFAPKLHNVLAQVGLHGPNAGRREGLIEADLFRKHRFRFGYEFCAVLLCDLNDNSPGLLPI